MIDLLRSYIGEVVKKCKKGDAKKGKPYGLYTKDGKKLLGRHKTKQDAYEQEYAIEKSKERAKKQ